MDGPTKQFVVLPPGGFGAPPNGAATTGIYFSPATLHNGTFNNLTGVYTSDSRVCISDHWGLPAIYGGQFQNVTAAPAGTAVVTINGGQSYATTVTPQGLVFHKYAYALAFADLPLPQGVEMAARAYDDEDVGMSIRLVTQYTINNDSEPTRADVSVRPCRPCTGPSVSESAANPVGPFGALLFKENLMPGGSSPVLGNVAMCQAIYASITPAASVLTDVSVTSTYTILGLFVGDMIDLYPQAAVTTLLTIGAVWVSALNTLSVQWINSTGSTSTSSPTAITFAVLVNRSQLSPYGVSNWPQAIE